MPENKKPNSTQTRVTATSNTVHVETPRGQGRRKPHVSVIVAPDELVGGFVGFLRAHAIVGLAVGFVIGTQVQTVVKQLISSFIDPTFQLVFGHSLNTATFTWHFHGRHADYGWGAFVYNLFDFLFILLIVYLAIRLFNLEKFDKPQK